MVFHSLLVNLATIQTVVNGTPKNCDALFETTEINKKATHCSLCKPILVWEVNKYPQ